MKEYDRLTETKAMHQPIEALACFTLDALRARALPERQAKVLRLMAEGETTKGAALKLGVSPKTIEFHRAGVMRRLGIFDVAGLTRFAIRAGVVAP